MKIVEVLAPADASLEEVYSGSRIHVDETTGVPQKEFLWRGILPLTPTLAAQVTRQHSTFSNGAIEDAHRGRFVERRYVGTVSHPLRMQALNDNYATLTLKRQRGETLTIKIDGSTPA